MLPTSGSLVVRTASVESQEALEEANTAQHCSTIQIKDVSLAMQGDNFECLLDDDGFKHIDTLQRCSKRLGRTPGFKDSNLNNLVSLNYNQLNQDATPKPRQ